METNVKVICGPDEDTLFGAFRKNLDCDFVFDIGGRSKVLTLKINSIHRISGLPGHWKIELDMMNQHFYSVNEYVVQTIKQYSSDVREGEIEIVSIK